MCAMKLQPHRVTFTEEEHQPTTEQAVLTLVSPRAAQVGNKAVMDGSTAQGALHEGGALGRAQQKVMQGLAQAGRGLLQLPHPVHEGVALKGRVAAAAAQRAPKEDNEISPAHVPAGWH